jgi:orotidine-5'-phosphate decarboxylase
MNTATLATDAEARHLVNGLTTEVATPGASPQIGMMEAAALAAIRALADHLHGRSIAFASSEWSKARQAIESWIRSAS